MKTVKVNKIKDYNLKIYWIRKLNVNLTGYMCPGYEGYYSLSFDIEKHLLSPPLCIFFCSVVNDIDVLLVINCGQGLKKE